MAASYPVSYKIFRTYADYTDTIFAQSVNEIHDEIVSIEKILGAQPLAGTPYGTVGGGLNDLYNNKAAIFHRHSHHDLAGDAEGDDHPQYMRVDGSRGFTAPVTSPPAVTPYQLVTKGQVESYGWINAGYAQSLIAQATTNLVHGVSSGNQPVWGPNPPTPAWKLTGGVVVGVTDGRGYLPCSFGGAFTTQVQGFVATKLPVGAGGGRPGYNYIEAQLTLIASTLTGVWVGFSHDYSFQANCNAAYSWLAIGF